MKLSVLVMTYNHGKFITQALESVLMQKVDFEYEILISEDCSTDNTREIVLNYKEKYPDKIRLLLSEKNLHSNEIVSRGIKAARGKYLATLDGDDYWTSPDKLQKQVNFLDNHSECSVCYHNVNVVYEDGKEPHPFHTSNPNHHISSSVPKAVSKLEDIVPGNFLQAGSVMFRTGLFKEFPDWYNSFFPITDWPIHIFNAEHGDLGYIDEILGAYRVHSGGLWSANMSFYRKIEDIEKVIYMFNTINKHLNFRFDKEIKEGINPLYFEAMKLLLSEKKYKEAREYGKKYFSGLPLRRKIRQKELFISFSKSYISKTIDFLSPSK
jgi:glycosyltransferase involved in cell wall biosynthesis